MRAYALPQPAYRGAAEVPSDRELLLAEGVIEEIRATEGYSLPEISSLLNAYEHELKNYTTDAHVYYHYMFLFATAARAKPEALELVESFIRIHNAASLDGTAVYRGSAIAPEVESVTKPAAASKPKLASMPKLAADATDTAKPSATNGDAATPEADTETHSLWASLKGRLSSMYASLPSVPSTADITKAIRENKLTASAVVLTTVAAVTAGIAAYVYRQKRLNRNAMHKVFYAGNLMAIFKSGAEWPDSLTVPVDMLPRTTPLLRALGMKPAGETVQEGVTFATFKPVTE